MKLKMMLHHKLEANLLAAPHSNAEPVTLKQLVPYLRSQLGGVWRRCVKSGARELAARLPQDGTTLYIPVRLGRGNCAFLRYTPNNKKLTYIDTHLATAALVAFAAELAHELHATLHAYAADFLPQSMSGGWLAAGFVLMACAHGVPAHTIAYARRHQLTLAACAVVRAEIGG